MVKEVGRVAQCPELGIIQEGDRFYPPDTRDNSIIVIGDDTRRTNGIIKVKRKDPLKCPAREDKSGLFVCKDCEFYIAKDRRNI